MNLLMNKIRTTYDFSEYELKVIRYVITALFYDLSKLILLALLFSYTGKLAHFVCALIPFFLLRTKNGGIHTNSYFSCLLLTVLVFVPTVLLLPVLAPLTPMLRLGLLIPCAIAEYALGPSLSHREVKLDEDGIQRNRLASFQVVLIVAVLLFLFPQSSCLLAAFWMTVLHAIQLAITKIYKEVKVHA